MLQSVATAAVAVVATFIIINNYANFIGRETVRTHKRRFVCLSYTRIHSIHPIHTLPLMMVAMTMENLSIHMVYVCVCVNYVAGNGLTPTEHVRVTKSVGFVFLFSFRFDEVVFGTRSLSPHHRILCELEGLNRKQYVFIASQFASDRCLVVFGRQAFSLYLSHAVSVCVEHTQKCKCILK